MILPLTLWKLFFIIITVSYNTPTFPIMYYYEETRHQFAMQQLISNSLSDIHESDN